MGTVKKTREEIEQALSRKYLGKVIIFLQSNGKELCGKVGRITCETAFGEPMAIFSINHTRYECDVDYFLENAQIQTNNGNRQ